MEFDNYIQVWIWELEILDMQNLVSYTKSRLFHSWLRGFVFVLGFLVYEYFFQSLCISAFCSPSDLVTLFFRFSSKAKYLKVFSVLQYYQRLFVLAYFISQSPGIYLQDWGEKIFPFATLMKDCPLQKALQGKNVLNQSKTNVM